MKVAGVLFALVAAAVAQTQDELSPGLAVTYRDSRHSLRRVDPAPRFWLEAAESLHPSLEPAFQAEWEGLLSVLQAGEYQFAPGAARIWIDGAPVGDKPLALSTGRHAIRIDYRRAPGRAVLQLRWKSAQFGEEPIPAERFSHRAGDAAAPVEERGRDLVEELGCVNCHTARSVSLRGRMGPELAGIGARVAAGWLEPWMAQPGAAMPDLLGDAERPHVAAYLASLKTGFVPAKVKRPGSTDAGRGNELYGSIGCAACHQQPGLSLEGVGSKMTLASLAAYLKDPAKVDPSGRMPSMLLSDADAFALAAYLTESGAPARASGGGDPARGKRWSKSAGVWPVINCAIRSRCPASGPDRRSRICRRIEPAPWPVIA